MKTALFILTIYTLCFSQYAANNFSGRFRDSLKCDSLRNASAVGTDSKGKFKKVVWIDSSGYATTAGSVPHNVTISRLGYSTGLSTWGTSLLDYSDDDWEVLTAAR
jgi:hypothetical protein